MLINSKNKKYGISLITLVITIVVVIILAAAVLLSLSKNNPIDNARIANLTQSKDSIESGILAYTSKIKAKTLAGLETKDIVLDISEKQGDSYISCKTTIDGEQINLYKIDESAFKNNIDELPRTPNKDSTWYVGENGRVYLLFESIDKVPNWMKNSENVIDNATLNQFVILTGSASKVAENPAEYYGKVVENYNEQDMEWKIFHSDGENIYLITSEYIPYEKIPTVHDDEKNEDVALNKGNYEKCAYFTDILDLENYSDGSGAIATDNSARKWLKSYFDYLSSNSTTSGDNSNMKAVAYMLDTKKWSSFTDGIYAVYAIGGPTVEMLFASYNKKHTDVDYRARAKNATGYEISKDGGTNWSSGYSGMLDTSDDLYVLPEQSLSGANCMWLASPSYHGSDDGMNVAYDR